MRIEDKVFDLLPYDEPFLFVDSIENISESGVTGYYTFKEDADFYRGHFKGFPLTPGVLLTECMAQIGMVALGIFLSGPEQIDQTMRFAFTKSNVQFKDMVKPGERVKVVSEKKLWRMGLLRCLVQLFKEDGTLAVEGELTGYRLD